MSVQPVSMSPAQAKKLAVLAPMAAAVLAFVASLSARQALPPATVVIGAVIAAVILSLLAEFAPAVAGGFGLLLLITAMFVVGGDAWTGLAKALRQGKSALPGSTTRMPTTPGSRSSDSPITPDRRTSVDGGGSW